MSWRNARVSMTPVCARRPLGGGGTRVDRPGGRGACQGRLTTRCFSAPGTSAPGNTPPKRTRPLRPARRGSSPSKITAARQATRRVMPPTCGSPRTRNPAAAGSGAYGRFNWNAPEGIQIASAGGYTREPNAFNEGWRARYWLEGFDGSENNVLLQGSGITGPTEVTKPKTTTFAPHLWPFPALG